MKIYTQDSIGRLIDRNKKVGKIWRLALQQNDLDRGERCAKITRRLSRIVADLLEGAV